MFRGLGPAQLPWTSLLAFSLSLSLFFLLVSLPLAAWFVQQDSTPSGFVQEPNSTCIFLFLRDWEILMNNFEDFKTFS